jgi:probable HAF family extracellular repeat protein
MPSLSSKVVNVLPALCFAGGLLAALPASAQTYTIKDLGVLGTTRFSIPHCVNQNGLVVGESNYQGGGAGKAFLYQNNAMVDLSPAGSLKSIAYSINTTGVIAGMVEDSSGNTHPALWRNGVASLLNYSGVSYAVNYVGAMVGQVQDASFVNHAFLWTPTVPNGGTGSLQYLNNGGSANAINHFTQVVGSIPSGTGSHAFLWDASHGSKDLGALGTSNQMFGTGINYSGIVIGSFVGAGSVFHAAVWTPTTTNGTTGAWGDLGIGQALSINSSGQIVGKTDTAAILWQNGVAKNLNTLIPAGSGWTLFEADSISDTGQITGAGSINGSMSHAFLLTPVH